MAVENNPSSPPKIAPSGRAPDGIIIPSLSRRAFLVGIGLLGTAGVAEIHPVSRAFIHSNLAELLKKLGFREWWNQIVKTVGPQSIEDRFPNRLEASEFTPLPSEEILNVYRQTQIMDPENYRGAIGFPFDLNVLGNNPPIKYNRLFNAILPPYINRQQFEEREVKNVLQITGLPKGTVIYAPVEGGAIITTVAGERIGEGQQAFIPAYTGLFIMFRDKEGRDYSVGISALQARALITTPPYPTKYSPVMENGAKIKLFQPILELTTDLQDWNGKGTTFPGQRGQVIINLSYDQRDPRAPIPLTVEFLRDTNGSILLASDPRGR